MSLCWDFPAVCSIWMWSEWKLKADFPGFIVVYRNVFRKIKQSWQIYVNVYPPSLYVTPETDGLYVYYNGPVYQLGYSKKPLDIKNMDQIWIS